MPSERERIDCDVAIVGAGPVGVTLAALLGEAGLSVFVGDANADVYPLPRAAHFDHEIMRVFQHLGIVDEIAPWIIASDRYVFQNAAGDVLLDFDLQKPADTGWRGHMMHQPGIERAIRARLERDPNVDLRTETVFQEMRQHADHVESRWQTHAGELDVVSRYLVGCDGGGSKVREGLAIKLDDLAFDEPWLVLDLVVEPDNGLPTLNIQYCDPNRPTTYVVMGNDRRRFEFMLKPGETAEAMLEDAAIDRLLLPWSTRGLKSVERKSVYRFHALIAERWREGRVFLAGDAAHQMPPFAGQGMCSGIRDAVALAWRLPLAMASTDDNRLLDSYQIEREPHVRAITQAAVATGRLVCTLDREMATGRDAQMLAAKASGAPMPDISSPPLEVAFGLGDTPRAGQRFFQPTIGKGDAAARLDDVLGAGPWLIARSAGDLSGIQTCSRLRIVSLDDPLLVPFASALDSWLVGTNQAAVLVRADRYVFGTGAPSDLLEAYAQQAGLAARIAEHLPTSMR